MDKDLFMKAVNTGGCKIRVTARKTKQIVQYEPEVFECNIELEIEESLSGMERMIATAIARAQAEYGMYYHMFKRGVVDKEELNNIKNINSNEIDQLIAKAKSIGIDASKVLGITGVESE